jgi:hypothetical protein
VKIKRIIGFKKHLKKEISLGERNERKKNGYERKKKMAV